MPWNNLKTLLGVTNHDAKGTRWQERICGAAWAKFCSIKFLPTPMVKNNVFSAPLSFTKKGQFATFF